MSGPSDLDLDDRDAARFVLALLARRPGFAPEWLPRDAGAGTALAHIAAQYWQAIAQRLNRAPYKNKLAFLDLLGMQLIPARAARAPVVLRLADNVPDGRVPAATGIAAPPPPESNNRIIFETERATGLMAGKLAQVVSLWPGRDQYIDHSAALLAGQAFQPFLKKQLQDTPHILYLAHDPLLALAGESTVDVLVELTTPSSERLDLLWEYWDGTLWREFLAMRPSCDTAAAAKLDGTNGLTRSGKFVLQTDCAKTAKTTVNGIAAFWIRGRLTQTLPPDPGRVLPEVDNIRIGTEVVRPLAFIVSNPATRPAVVGCGLAVTVRDKSGQPLTGLTVTLETGGAASWGTDGDPGRYCFSSVTYDDDPQTVTVMMGSVSQSTTLVMNDSLSTYELTFTLSGLGLDKAFADQLALDVTKTFQPFGVQPQPGATFYFTNEELFSKPGAKFTLFVEKSATAQDQIVVAGTTPLNHTLVWEYWNGRQWTFLSSYSNTGAGVSADDFTATGLMDIDLSVPRDMEKTTVNEQDGLWMRIRLVSGGFGFVQTIAPPDGTTFSFVVPQPPALADLRIGYTWQYGPFAAQHVMAYNDFSYADRTDEARWPGVTFQPFTPVSGATPGLYLGFDKALPVDRVGLLFDIVEQRGDTDGPALLWEYWDGLAWETLIADDETHNLRLPGIVALIGPEDSRPLARFDAALNWLRARLKEDGPPGAPTINGIFPNAVWAVQQQTVVNEPVGASTGQPNQRFSFRQVPVLPAERVEVRELAGLRADVEWRLTAKELSGGNPGVIAVLEGMLAKQGPDTDIEMADLRLVRNRNKQVTEVWVRWQGQPHLFFSGPGDRHYVVDRTRGGLLFGDGVQGRVPPVGAAIVARQYQSGGGSAGNVPAATITQMVGSLGGVQGVSNPRAAEGGAEAETVQALSGRAPRTIRHRGRALAPPDYETMAREANAGVAVARAIPCRDSDGHQAPGWVTVVIIPQTTDPRPWPSFGLREEVRTYIETRAAADLAAAGHIHVTGPDYVAVDVEAVIVPRDPAQAGAVEALALQGLQTFLHPLLGGPDGQGWQPGRDVFMSDVASALERISGVDYVKQLCLLLNGVLQAGGVKVPEGKTVVAGALRLKVIEG
jgi:Baseplate J-like protein